MKIIYFLIIFNNKPILLWFFDMMKSGLYFYSSGLILKNHKCWSMLFSLWRWQFKKMVQQFFTDFPWEVVSVSSPLHLDNITDVLGNKIWQNLWQLPPKYSSEKTMHLLLDSRGMITLREGFLLKPGHHDVNKPLGSQHTPIAEFCQPREIWEQIIYLEIEFLILSVSSPSQTFGVIIRYLSQSLQLSLSRWDHKHAKKISLLCCIMSKLLINKILRWVKLLFCATTFE